VRSRIAAAALVLSPATGCGSDPTTTPADLATASNAVVFSSTEALGPHACTSIQTRVDRRAGTQVSQREETTKLRWTSWDDFDFASVVDGKPQTSVRVTGQTAMVRDGKSDWRQRPDPEPYRAQLRATWNTWDATLEPFEGRVVLTSEGQEVVGGRSTQVYAVSLGPPLERARARATTTPVALAGRVWLDEATAVRLKADITGTVQQRDLERSLALRLDCSGSATTTP
jgi:hypothetical protein